MAEQQAHYPGHYSGDNKVPTISKFLQSLDKDKAERDKKLDEEARAAKSGKNAPQYGDAKPHEATLAGIKGTQKKVTDPTTGKEVTIEDVDKKMMENVENPTLSVPNANLGKDTVRSIQPTLRADKS